MNQLDFGGRVAIVTGAGRGMGREHALMLASRGARVVVNDVNAETAAETASLVTEAGGAAVVDTHDIRTQAAELVTTALDAWGQLAVVVNNAGINRFGRFAATDPTDWWGVFDTHFRGTVEVSRCAWPHLAASGSGRLINISSSAMIATPNASAYAAAKAAIWGLGNALFHEGDEVGVQVTTVQPSAWTPSTAKSFDDPVVRDVLRDRLTSRSVAAFVTWLAHQDTAFHGECVQMSADSAGLTTFAVTPRMRVDASEPEVWVAAADQLAQRDLPLTALRTTSESFRAELVFAAPELESSIPHDVADITKKVRTS